MVCTIRMFHFCLGAFLSFTAAAAFTSYVKSHCFCPKDLLTQWPADFIIRKLGRAAKAAQYNTENQYRDWHCSKPFQKKNSTVDYFFFVQSYEVLHVQILGAHVTFVK